MLTSPGKHLRRVRERLLLKYRDVEEASLKIANTHNNLEFVIGLSRLADIENKGTVPSVFRMYSLGIIYGMDYGELLKIYGVALQNSAADAARLQLHVTKPVSTLIAAQASAADLHTSLLPVIDLRKTWYLSRQVQGWGKLPFQFLETAQTTHHRYAIVGTDDWSMNPLIPPGSFIQIDLSKKRVASTGWDNDFARPVYLLELRHGYRIGWCTETPGTVIVQPHSSSMVPAEIFKLPGEVEVLGQIVAVAMRLDRGKPRRKRSSSGRE